MTLAEIRTAAQALGYGTDTATAQTQAVVAEYRRVNALRRWKFLEDDNTALTTTLGSNVVSTATITDLQFIDAIRLELGTDYIELDYREPQEFRDLQHIDRDNGIPQYWTEVAGELRLWPRPDAAYTLTIDYIKRPAGTAALDEDTDTPIWPEEYHDILVWATVMWLAFRERDWLAYSTAKENRDLRVREMMAAVGVKQRQTSGEVVRSDFWREAGGWG